MWSFSQVEGIACPITSFIFHQIEYVHWLGLDRRVKFRFDHDFGLQEKNIMLIIQPSVYQKEKHDPKSISYPKYYKILI